MFYFVKELVWLQHSNAKGDVIDFYIVVWNNPDVLICVFSVEVCVLCTWRCTDFFTSTELAFDVKHCKFLTCLIYNMFICS